MHHPLDKEEHHQPQTETAPYQTINSYQIGFTAACGNRIVDPNWHDIIAVSPSNRHGAQPTENFVVHYYMNRDNNEV